MIFVTIGNNPKGFPRLLEAVDAIAGQGVIRNETVFLQMGNTEKFCPRHCEHRPFLPMDEFQNYLEKSDLIISHGGSGTVLSAVRLGRIPVVMPRRKKYSEHINDHQMQLVRALASEGRVIPAYEPENLPAAIEEARRRNMQTVPAPPSRMLELVARAIEEFENQRR